MKLKADDIQHEEKSARRTVNTVGAVSSNLKTRVTDNVKDNVEKNQKKTKNRRRNNASIT